MTAFAGKIRFEDLLIAYRKAKAEAYYESTHFHARSFAEYERKITMNLSRLLERLQSDGSSWCDDSEFLGDFAYLPKSIDGETDDGDTIYFKSLEPLDEWRRKWELGGERRILANFRLVIRPSVDFQIIAALWLLKVGHRYDACLDDKVAFANRIRRLRSGTVGGSAASQRPPNLDCNGLFPPYFSGYRAWREKGLKAMRDNLKADKEILAVTMDLSSFYHRVSPQFLLRDSFLRTIGLKLNSAERSFTRDLVAAIDTWYKKTPDYRDRREGALPVGLSASKIIANALMIEFDKEVTSKLQPLYYGRYVDDVFLVVESKQEIQSGSETMRWLASRLARVAKYQKDSEDKAMGLRVLLRYAKDSDLLFAGAKLKVFRLSGDHGLDLVSSIEEQIRAHSSEHRLLPELPTTGQQMAGRALLAQSSASLEPDALRKADVVSVRRLGLSLLLRDVECYARDLMPSGWRSRRQIFYDLVYRHAVTPTGFFEFFHYIPRVLGVMIACRDFEESLSLVRKLGEVRALLQETTTAGTRHAKRFQSCCELYAVALSQVILQATSVNRFPWRRAKKLLAIFRELEKHGPGVQLPRTTRQARALSKLLFFADLGRRPYRDAWLNRSSLFLRAPPIPRSIASQRVLRLGAVRALRKLTDLKPPYWPAIAFSTRPVTLAELTQAAPAVLYEPNRLRRALFAFRGARTRGDDGVMLQRPKSLRGPSCLVVGGAKEPNVCVAVPSFLTKAEEWEAAAKGKPLLSISRYERVRKTINEILRNTWNTDYIVMPECSLPSQWAAGIAFALAKQKISLIAGLEYTVTPLGVRNDAFISLSTDWPWYRHSIFFRQPKFSPSHKERKSLWGRGKKRLYSPRGPEKLPTIYGHDGFFFSVLICSDLTTIKNRELIQGEIDALFVLEWNRDIDSFGVLVEAAAHDLHAYIVQVNNREFGDSRIRTPRREPYLKDLVRIRGGEHDYFVVSTLDVDGLRKAQLSKSESTHFKPVPIGYQMSDARKK